MRKFEMAHAKKDNKLDQLLDIVGWLATEIKTMKEEINSIKQAGPVESKQEWPLEWEIVIDEAKDKRETPYKVIPIQSIIRDEWYVDPAMQGLKKIYMGMWRTFKNKKDATDYLDRMKKTNPGQQYDIFPV